MATKPLPSNPVADLPENWTNGQTVAPSGSSVGLSQQHGYNYLMGKVNEALTDIGTINDAFGTNVPAPSDSTPSAVGSAGAAGTSEHFSRADHVHAAPQPGTANPVMNGTASPGTAATWSRSDHVHPADTNRQAKITASGLLKGDGNGGVTANGTVSVAQGGTGLATMTNVNAVPVANGTSATGAMQAVRSASGAFYSTGQDVKPQFGTLPVAQGGTGKNTWTANYAVLTGTSATGAFQQRAITNNTATSTALTANTNLITANTLRYHTNRTTSVAAADTNYTTYMARGTALSTTQLSSLANGQICWIYG